MRGAFCHEWTPLPPVILIFSVGGYGLEEGGEEKRREEQWGGGWLRDVTGRAVCEAGRDGGEAALGRRLQVGDVGLLGSSWGRPGTGLASRRGRLC